MEQVHNSVAIYRLAAWNGPAPHHAPHQALGNLMGEHREGVETVDADAIRAVEIEKRSIGQVAGERDGRVCAQIVIGPHPVQAEQLFLTVGHKVLDGVRTRRRRGVAHRQGGDRSVVIAGIGVVGRNVIDQGIAEVGIAHGVGREIVAAERETATHVSDVERLPIERHVKREGVAELLVKERLNRSYDVRDRR
jgi:hypothetical protein